MSLKNNKYIAQIKINKTKENKIKEQNRVFSINNVKQQTKEINQNQKVNKRKKKGLSL